MSPSAKLCVRELCATKLGVKELWVTLRRRAGRTQWCGEPRTGMNRPSGSLWHPEVGYMYFNDSWWIFMIFQYPRNFRFWSLTFFDPKICQGSHPTQSRRGLVSVAWHHQGVPKQPCSRPSLRVRGVLWEASMAFNGSNMLKSPNTRMDLIRCKTPMESYLSNMGCIMMHYDYDATHPVFEHWTSEIIWGTAQRTKMFSPVLWCQGCQQRLLRWPL